jgi:hypothetical protein
MLVNVQKNHHYQERPLGSIVIIYKMFSPNLEEKNWLGKCVKESGRWWREGNVIKANRVSIVTTSFVRLLAIKKCCTICTSVPAVAFI